LEATVRKRTQIQNCGIESVEKETILPVLRPAFVESFSVTEWFSISHMTDLSLVWYHQLIVIYQYKHTVEIVMVQYIVYTILQGKSERTNCEENKLKSECSFFASSNMIIN